MTDLERAAKAASAHLGVVSLANGHAEACATAVIEALAEPSEARVNAVARALARAAHGHVLGAYRWERWVTDARAAIRADMLAALGREP